MHPFPDAGKAPPKVGCADIKQPANPRVVQSRQAGIERTALLF